MGHKLRRCRRMLRRVPQLREAARSSPAYLSAGHTQSSSPCSRVRSPTLPTRSFQVCAFAFCYVAFVNNISGRNHDLDGFPIVHCAVTVRNAVKINGTIEHATGFDTPRKNVRQEFLDISTHRSRPAADRDIVIKCWLRSGNRLLLRNADTPHRAARTSYADRGIHRLLEPD